MRPLEKPFHSLCLHVLICHGGLRGIQALCISQNYHEAQGRSSTGESSRTGASGFEMAAPSCTALVGCVKACLPGAKRVPQAGAGGCSHCVMLMVWPPKSAPQLLYVLSLCSRWTAGPWACCFILSFTERCPSMVSTTKTSFGRSAAASTGSPRSPQVRASGSGRSRFCCRVNAREESPAFPLSSLQVFAFWQCWLVGLLDSNLPR